MSDTHRDPYRDTIASRRQDAVSELARQSEAIWQAVASKLHLDPLTPTYPPAVTVTYSVGA